MDKQNMVEFNQQKLERLKKAYAKAGKGEVFVFEGNKYVKEYAGYMIQYLETVFRKRGGRRG